MLSEAPGDSRLDAEMTGRVDGAVLVEGDLDARRERHVRLRVFRQRPHDPQRLMGLECPRPDGRAIARVKREVIGGARRQRLCGTMCTDFPSAAGSAENARAGSTVNRPAAAFAGVASSLVSVKPVPTPTTPFRNSSGTSSATGCHGLAASFESGPTVGSAVGAGVFAAPVPERRRVSRSGDRRPHSSPSSRAR